MATTDEVTIETEIEPTTNNNNVTTEQPTSGGLNVQQDTSAEAHAERLQKEQDLRKLDDEIRMLRQVLRDKEQQARIIRTDLGKGTAIDTVENVAKDFEHGINKFAEDVSQTDAFKNTTAVVGEIGRTTVSGLSSFGTIIGAKFNEVRQSESVNNIAGKATGLGSSLLDTVSNLTKPAQKEFNDGSQQ